MPIEMLTDRDDKTAYEFVKRDSDAEGTSIGEECGIKEGKVRERCDDKVEVQIGRVMEGGSSQQERHVAESARKDKPDRSEKAMDKREVVKKVVSDKTDDGNALRNADAEKAVNKSLPDGRNGVHHMAVGALQDATEEKRSLALEGNVVKQEPVDNKEEHYNANSSPSRIMPMPDSDNTVMGDEMRLCVESEDVDDEIEVGREVCVKMVIKTPEKTENTLVERKRVRFSDAHDILGAATQRTGLFGIIRQRRQWQRRMDEGVFVQVERDEKGRQVVLDELQYLLDGIFDSKARKGARVMNTGLVTSSLKSLVELLLKKGKKGSEGEDGILLAILGRESQLLKKILNSLFEVLGRSRLVDVLVALVFVVVFRSTSQVLLMDECNMDVLLTGFFRNSGSCLQEDDAGRRKVAAANMRAEKEETRPRVRKRGRIHRRFEQAQERNGITSVNGLVIKAEIMDEGFKGFKNEAEGSAYLMGVSLSLLLEGQETARQWMRENRRLDRVVAVLYSAKKVLLAKGRLKEESNDEVKLQTSDLEDHVATSIVMNAAMKVLEYAMLDPVCRLRVARESSVDRIALDLIRRVTRLRGGIVAAETMLSSALRMCLNLLYDCREGSEKFVRLGGVQVVVDCLATEGCGAGLVEDVRAELESKECFDVRVLCLTVLAGMIYEHRKVREGFSKVHAWGIAEREGGSVGLILEMLKRVGIVDKTFGGGSLQRGEQVDAESEGPSSIQLDTKIIVGYFCLTVGTLVHNCDPNKMLLERLMPQQSMLGIASVLDEFLEFHQEIGATSVAMERMCEKITMGLLESAQGVKSEAVMRNSDLVSGDACKLKENEDVETEYDERRDEKRNRADEVDVERRENDCSPASG